jgi:hypothetical protein
MIEYIPDGIFRASFKVCMGDKLREKMEGRKKHETFFSALKIVFLNNFENCKSPFKNETQDQE